MSTRNWRDKLSPRLNRKLDKLLWRVVEHEQSYQGASDEGKAQIWVALAEIFDQIDSLNRKLEETEGNGRKGSTEGEESREKEVFEQKLDEKLRESLINY